MTLSSAGETGGNATNEANRDVGGEYHSIRPQYVMIRPGNAELLRCAPPALRPGPGDPD